MRNGHDDIAQARSALLSIDASCSREDWVRVGMAAKAAGLLEADFIEWSATGSNFGGERDARSVWRSLRSDGGISAATLFHLAGGIARGEPRQQRRRGERPTSNAPARSNSAAEKSSGRQSKPQADTVALLDSYLPADADHAYVAAKRGSADGLRVVPAGSTLTIQGHSVAGWLVVPVRSLDGELRTLQYIPPPGAGKKLNSPGASFGDGLFVVGDITADGSVYVCEGIGQAWACARADYRGAAVVTFGAGRCKTVATLLRERYPTAHIVIVPDRGKEADAENIARQVGGAWATLPADKPANYDANDYEAEYGPDALGDLLRAAREPGYGLDVAFADELSGTVATPDELVQGLLTAGGGSVLYGDSNSGKTFFVIDMAAAVARGAEWMGRRTESGLVVYLAAESPSSVLVRLQAYQRYHDVLVPNFAITRSPINLFESGGDTDAIISTVRQLEKRCGQPVRLIVGDTLARLSAGANENAGQDMGVVIERFDRIRTECRAHFLLIHHAGKTTASGARGWSGIRAAIDTEIEVTDSPTGRCAEVTKQRDLASKGERIGFRLETVQLGLSKWGTPITSCVVLPDNAPSKPTKGKKLGQVEGAVLEFLRERGSGAKKAEVAKHFDGQYGRASVYRACTTLAESGRIHETAGVVAFALGAT